MPDGRQELHDLERSSKNDPKESPAAINSENLHSAIESSVEASLEKMESRKKIEEQNARMEEERKVLEASRQREQDDIQAVKKQVVESINEEAERDPEFAKLINDTRIPTNIVEYISEVCDPDEAPMVLREVIKNSDYQNELSKCVTFTAASKVMKKARKAVLSGQNLGKPPEMIKKNIPVYNPNHAQSASIDDYLYSSSSAMGLM